MLENLTAFVTGASRGIGRTIATTLAGEGANVALAARSDGIHETAAEIADDRALAVQCDVTDEASVAAAIDETVGAFGGLDCLVNNAGIAGPTKPVEDVEREEWDRTMAVNVAGPFLTTKHAVPHLRESDQASIVNISSMSGKRPLEERSPYTASKMAVMGMTRTLAHELGEDRITVNAVCPGATTGERMEETIAAKVEETGMTEAAVREYFTRDAAIPEFVDPEDTAEIVAYLASEKARHVTAQDLGVDAGMTWY